MRLVIDTNLFISAAINGRFRAQLGRVLLNPALTILADMALLAEVGEVIHRPKFNRYITDRSIIFLIGRLNLACLCRQPQR